MSNENDRNDAGEPVQREADGRWKKGHNPNAGGLTRAQARVARMLEDMSEEAAQRLLELMRSGDEKIALGAVSEWMKRVAPPPPKAAPPVNINVGVDDAAAYLAVMRARAAARKATMVLEASPVASAAASMLPAPAETPIESEEG
jgi:hypothetical protein